MATQATLHVSVAIPTYNGAGRLPGVLDQLRTQQNTIGLTWEVLVCDNNSTDATADVVRQYQKDWPELSELRYVFAAQQGAAFARQRAVEQAQGDIIAFLDDDNVPDSDWLYNVFQFGQSHPKAGAFGSQIHGKFEGPLPKGFERIACFLAIIERGSQPHQYVPQTKILPPAAGLAVRRQAWLEAVPRRLFLNNKGKAAGLASEDIEALLHIQKAGWQIWYNPDMVVTHHIPNGRLQRDYLITLFRCVGLSRYYIRLLGTKDWQRPLMVPAYIANDLRKLALYYLRRRTEQDWLDACEREHLVSTLKSPLFLLKKAGNDLHQSVVDRLRFPQRQSWLDRLSEAFEQEQFQLYRQRVTAVQSPAGAAEGPADHYELLLRLNEGEAEQSLQRPIVISPGQFLPVAERYGLTATIDRWVVRHYLQSSPEPQLHAINLSAASVCDRSFASFVADQLTQSFIPPHCLGFEITETLVRRYFNQVRALTQALQAMGCQITIDDVSFVLPPEQLCQDLQPNYLKFSHQLVQLLVSRPVVRARTQKQVSMIHSWGSRTVAKGIDKASMLSPIRQAGIDFAQGYQLSAPVPVTGFQSLPLNV
ncbi:MAG: hormogonium polysaccharide biosynthesis glycosyltransferase HpsE [Cyanobacteria bacterium J06648_16]